MKKFARKVAFKGVRVSRGIIKKSPRLKRIAKEFAAQVMPVYKKDSYASWIEKNFPDFIDIAKLRVENSTLAYTPLVSIVVPTYNTDHDFLRDCIESVQAQIYENWELVIVDDASTDEAVRTFVKEYAKNDTRIVYKFLKKK